MTVKLKGIAKVSANLNKEILKMKGASLKGLIEASIIIRRSMETTSPLTPVNLGNLRASWYVVTAFSTPEGSSASFEGEQAGQLTTGHGAAIGQSKGLAAGKRIPFVVMGFSARYAAAVHEMVDATYKRPGAGPKFLESAIKRNTTAILQVIRKNVSL